MVVGGSSWIPQLTKQGRVLTWCPGLDVNFKVNCIMTELCNLMSSDADRCTGHRTLLTRDAKTALQRSLDIASDNEDWDKDQISSWVSPLEWFSQGQFDLSRCEEVFKSQDSITEICALYKSCKCRLNLDEGNYWFVRRVLWLLQS